MNIWLEGEKCNDFITFFLLSVTYSVILNATRRISVDLSSTFLNAENANVQVGT